MEDYSQQLLTGRLPLTTGSRQAAGEGVVLGAQHAGEAFRYLPQSSAEQWNGWNDCPTRLDQRQVYDAGCLSAQYTATVNPKYLAKTVRESSETHETFSENESLTSKSDSLDRVEIEQSTQQLESRLVEGERTEINPLIRMDDDEFWNEFNVYADLVNMASGYDLNTEVLFDESIYNLLSGSITDQDLLGDSTEIPLQPTEIDEILSGNILSESTRDYGLEEQSDSKTGEIERLQSDSLAGYDSDETIITDYKCSELGIHKRNERNTSVKKKVGMPRESNKKLAIKNHQECKKTTLFEAITLMLKDNDCSSISWLDEGQGIFKVKNTTEFAHRLSQFPGRRFVKFEHVTRSFRSSEKNRNIMIDKWKISDRRYFGKRKVYQFNMKNRFIHGLLNGRNKKNRKGCKKNRFLMKMVEILKKSRDTVENHLGVSWLDRKKGVFTISNKEILSEKLCLAMAGKGTKRAHNLSTQLWRCRRTGVLNYPVEDAKNTYQFNLEHEQVKAVMESLNTVQKSC